MDDYIEMLRIKGIGMTLSLAYAKPLNMYAVPIVWYIHRERLMPIKRLSIGNLFLIFMSVPVADNSRNRYLIRKLVSI